MIFGFVMLLISWARAKCLFLNDESSMVRTIIIDMNNKL